jgi:hypothetical protein
MTKPQLSQNPITPEQALSFRDATRRQIETWPTNIPNYTAAPGTPLVYDEMGQAYRRRMLEDGLNQRFGSMSVEGGLAVIPRFLYAGVAKAAQLGYTLEQLKLGMYNRKSYESLSLMTNALNDVIVQHEMIIGLRPGGLKSVDESLDHYTFDPENGLGYQNFERDRGLAVMDSYIRHGTFNEPSKDGESMCEGQRAGVLAMAYRAMMLISLADPNLFQATIALKNTPKVTAS